ncbi:N-acetylmuramoyl-L-alanine amidase [Silvimonas sp. JCM 19000]
MNKFWLGLGALLVGVAVSAQAQTQTIALDVGHYLDKPGATSAYGVTEFSYNQALAEAVSEKLLSAGYTVRLIGDDGQAKDLHRRAAAATGADLLVSLHHDSTQPQFMQSWTVDGGKQMYSDRSKGYSVFVSRENPQFARSSACASALGQQMQSRGFSVNPAHAEKIAGESRDWLDEKSGVYTADFTVLSESKVPALLLESGVIVNRDEARKLNSATTRATIGDAILAAVKACLQ